MYKLEDICSISDFVRNASRHTERLRETRRPEVLTLNGSPELVVQNAQAYQALLDRLDELETVAALNEAAEEIDRGEGMDANDMLARIRKDFGIRQRVR